METLNILVFNWRDPSHPEMGGAEKMTYEIAKRWVRMGHTVRLVCGNHLHGRRHEDVGGIKVTRLGGKYSLYPLAAAYYRIYLRKKYDVVIDEINTVPFFTPLYVEEPKVALIHQLAAEILYSELSQIQAKFWHLMEHKVLRLYKNVPVVMPSKSTKADMVKIGLPESILHVIAVGVDHAFYKPCGEKDPDPSILYVGRLRRFKGIHLLVESMVDVIQKLPNAKLIVAGRGDSEYMAELKCLTINLKLKNHVTICGYVSEEEKIKLMQRAHVLVFPSQREGFGLVVLEANACGTPVVATDVPGLRDAVVNGKTGLLVPYGNVPLLSEAILAVLTDDKMRRELSRNAVEWSRRFNWDESARQFLNIIRGAINGNIEG